MNFGKLLWISGLEQMDYSEAAFLQLVSLQGCCGVSMLNVGKMQLYNGSSMFGLLS
ncbi:hypothetical protein MANES_08G088262v8 [Manihot esculenta]|uniref:Uncharacterized protein n=1 Tax=Manihot esculenta TaxID=3983 RepID=A0ACB7H9S4_MANES|nr:hypothetical protein MANES_08G088262v8 [Manihot esculenta]